MKRSTHDKAVLALIKAGNSQAYVAKIFGVSRQRINQIVHYDEYRKRVKEAYNRRKDDAL